LFPVPKQKIHTGQDRLDALKSATPARVAAEKAGGTGAAGAGLGCVSTRGWLAGMKDGVLKWTHGPSFEEGGIRFRLWAPKEEQVALVVEGRDPIAMASAENGFFEIFESRLSAGARYRFALSSGQQVPDPASRFQPDDVNGPSEAIDPDTYRWRSVWTGREWHDVALYELHVGAFSPQGTFAGAALKLDHLAGLGVTAVEIMPVSDFKGRWNWGYDGAFPYAPDASYGRPEDFKAFVEAAHERGIAVLLDVVYNHFGPEGNFLPLYAPDFFTSRHKTPWGDAIQFDGPNSRPVRDFFIENAEYWIEEFHLDGLRFDAVHAIKDDTRPDLLDELATRVRARFSRPIHLLLENEDNDPRRLTRDGDQAKLYTAQWNDDIHHVLHVAATHESSGYYRAYGSTELLGKAIAEGFAYQGEMMPYRNAPRGGPSAKLPPTAFVSFLQNHDQIGNRAFGERLNVLAPPEAMRALVSVYLLAPQIPMLFMGEEWGATQPFLFFCDFDGELAEAVRNGRREEFSRFPEFADPERVAKIPDPLAESTFLASKLDWSRVDEKHLAYYRELLKARRDHIWPLLPSIRHGGDAQVVGDQALRVIWRASEGRLVLDANLSSSPIEFPPIEVHPFWLCGHAGPPFGPWTVRWGLDPE
jgi:maltooligosyltrehalose trehalohydrolase